MGVEVWKRAKSLEQPKVLLRATRVLDGVGFSTCNRALEASVQIEGMVSRPPFLARVGPMG